MVNNDSSEQIHILPFAKYQFYIVWYLLYNALQVVNVKVYVEDSYSAFRYMMVKKLSCQPKLVRNSPQAMHKPGKE